MNIPLYAFKSLAYGPEGQTLFLNANNSGAVTVQYSAAPTSEWALFYVPELAAVMIINSASGQALTALDDNRTVKTSSDLKPSDHNTWTFSAAEPGPAIRSRYNPDLNLNINGTTYPEGTHVIVYKWDGERNSRWEPVPVSSALATTA